MRQASSRFRRRSRGALKHHQESLEHLGWAAGASAGDDGRVRPPIRVAPSAPGWAAQPPPPPSPAQASPAPLPPSPPPPSPSPQAALLQPASPEATWQMAASSGVPSANWPSPNPTSSAEPTWHSWTEPGALPPEATGTGQESVWSEERIRSSIGWLAAAVTAAVVALVVVLVTSGTGSVHTATSRQAPPSATQHRPAASSTRSSSPPASSQPSAQQTGGGASGQPTVSRTSSASSLGSIPSASTPAPAAAAPGGAPTISGLSPASGPAGTTVTLTGNGFFSASGVVTVLFGQVQAPVSCPTQQSCVVTVPPQPAPASPTTGGASASRTVAVTVATDSGRSAPANFSYTG